MMSVPRETYWAHDPGHAYLVVDARDTGRALLCVTGYDYQDASGRVWLEEDCSAGVYLRNFCPNYTPNDYPSIEVTSRPAQRLSEPGALARVSYAPPVDDQTTRIIENLRDFHENRAAYTLYDLEELFEDRDPAEFL